MMDDQFIAFCQQFSRKLNVEQIKCAIDYFEFNEFGLALDCLCGIICETNLPITNAEYKKICMFHAAYGFPLHIKVIDYLKGLTKKE